MTSLHEAGMDHRLRLIAAIPHVLLLMASAVGLIHFSLANAAASRFARQADAISKTSPNEAFALALRAKEAWPTNTDALIINAQLEYRRTSGQYAVDLLERAIATADSPGIPMRLLGSLWVNNPETLEKGMAMMQRGLRLAPPKGAEAQAQWSRLGEAAMEARQYGLAIWAFNHAEGSGYEDESLNRNLSWAYESLRLKQGARSR